MEKEFMLHWTLKLNIFFWWWKKPLYIITFMDSKKCGRLFQDYWFFLSFSEMGNFQTDRWRMMDVLLRWIILENLIFSYCVFILSNFENQDIFLRVWISIKFLLGLKFHPSLRTIQKPLWKQIIITMIFQEHLSIKIIIIQANVIQLLRII
jgi:hypothetical protein